MRVRFGGCCRGREGTRSHIGRCTYYVYGRIKLAEKKTTLIMIIENGDEIATSVTTRKIKCTLIAHANLFIIIILYYTVQCSCDEATRKLIIILLLSYRRPHYLQTHTRSRRTNRGKRAV